MAPKAYLGNYKIYGSPEVNDFVTDDVIIMAIEDAFNDGMDVVSFSSGGPSFSGPLDAGDQCGNDPGIACDLVATTFEAIANKGVVVVAAAGNDGDTGINYPTFNSISSPGDAPSVIAVGAVTNTHYFLPVLNVPGPGVPSNLQTISVQTGDYIPPGAVTAPLRDVTAVGDSGYACSALPVGSLAGTIALIQRGGPNGTSCNFGTKGNNAWNAGAVGIVFYMADQSAPIAPGGLSSVGIPAVMVSNSDGLALKSFVASHPGQAVTIDPNGIEQSTQGNQLVSFSAFGPAAGSSRHQARSGCSGHQHLHGGRELRSAGRRVQLDGLRRGGWNQLRHAKFRARRRW